MLTTKQSLNGPPSNRPAYQPAAGSGDPAKAEARKQQVGGADKSEQENLKPVQC